MTANLCRLNIFAILNLSISILVYYNTYIYVYFVSLIESDLLLRITDMCDQLLSPPNKSQTLRHSLYGNEILLCKTPYGDSQGLLGIIHHDVAELQEKLEKQVRTSG